MSPVVVGAAAISAAVIALGAAVSISPDSQERRPIRHPDRPALDDIGWTRGLWIWEAIRCGSLVTASVATLAIGLPVLIALLGGLAPSVWVRVRAQAVRDRSRRAIATLVSSTESALRSGTSVPDALRRATESVADPLASRSIEGALRSFELGSSLGDALGEAARESGDERRRDVLATLALGIEERLPRERLADLLASISERLAFEDGLADEVTARAAGARQQQWLLAGLVPALAVYLAATLPMLAATLSSDLGHFVLLPVAGALEVGGIVLSRRVVRGSMP